MPSGGRPWGCRTRSNVLRTLTWTSGRVTTLPESPHPEGRLSQLSVLENPTASAPTQGVVQRKETSAADPFVLSDDDEPVPDPEHDKFNLANQFPREELLQALEEQNVTQDSSGRTQEE
jgi:hypothetical protein